MNASAGIKPGGGGEERVGGAYQMNRYEAPAAAAADNVAWVST